MKNEWIAIDSGDRLPDCDRCFRVIAGPGAGKTFWLCGHIANTRANGCRLTSAARIACITYTNVGVSVIRSNLSNADRIEVSTIHSFLYQNLVGPYLEWLTDDNENPMVNMDRRWGLTEHAPTIGDVRTWADTSSIEGIRKVMKDPDVIARILRTFQWQFVGDTLQPSLSDAEYNRHESYSKALLKDKNALFEYKKLAHWHRGYIHYEDVLYFAYLLISEHPRLLEFLSARFPYMFLDEFQDTHPIQTRIVEQLALQGTVVGIVGDHAQAIYSFQGTDRQGLITLSLPNQADYVITNNRRSSRNIVAFLNHMRSHDEVLPEQVSWRPEDGTPVCALVGEFSDAYGEVCRREAEYSTDSRPTDVLVLARKNNYMRKLRRADRSERDLDTEMEGIKHRKWFVRTLIEAIDMLRKNDLGSAVKSLLLLFRGRRSELRSPLSGAIPSETGARAMAVSVAVCLSGELPGLVDRPLLHLYEGVKKVLAVHNVRIENVREGGTPHKVLSQYTVRNMLEVFGDSAFGDRPVLSIHAAKGDEFPVVMVSFENEKQLEDMLTEWLDRKEDEGRIYYVGLSRAMDRLYLHVPELSAKHEATLREWGASVYRLGEHGQISLPI